VDTVQITVSNTNAAPGAGSNQTYTQFCAPGPGTQVIAASAAPPQGTTLTWTASGTNPAGATIASPNSPTTVISGLNGTGTYVFTYSVSNGACSSSTTHTIYNMPGVTNLSQPANQTLACNAVTATIPVTYSYGLTTTSAGLTRTGSVLSQPAGSAATITAPSGNPTGTDNWTLANMRMPGTYVFRLEYRNACSTQHRDVSVVVSRPPTAVNAGSDPVIACNATSTFLAGSVPDTATGNWSQVSGPNTATVASPNSANTALTGLVPGVYIFRWMVNGGVGCTPQFDEVTVTVASPTVTTAAAGPDTAICNIFPHKLSSNTPGLTQTGTWSVSPSAGVSFSSINDPKATVFGLAGSTQYRFVWTIANNCSSSSDTAFVTTDATVTQMVVDAGPNQCLASGVTSISLAGSTTADPAVTRTWTALDGGTLAFPTSATTTVSVPGNGTYRFVYTLTKTGCSAASDTVGITISAPVTAAAAGADQTLCTSSYPASINLVGNTPTVGSSLWTVAVGAAGTSFSAATSPSNTVSGLGEGIYFFLYTVSNGFCAASTDSVKVTLGRPPSAANAGADITSCNLGAGSGVTLAAVAPTVGTGYWAVISGPQGTTPTFTNGTSPTGSFGGWSSGTYLLKWTTLNSPVCPTSSDTMQMTVSASANANPLNASNSLCAATSILLTGTQNTSGTWSVTAGTPTPTLTVTSGNTATATGLVPGSYSFRYDLAQVGSCTATNSTRTVVVYAQPPAADAGADVELCPGATSVTLTGSAPGAGAIGSWARSSGPGTPTPGTANSNPTDTTINSLQIGVHVFRYSVNTNGVCAASQDSTQVIIERAANAGPDQNLCEATSVTFAATAPVFYTAQWTAAASNPTAVTFANSAAPNSSATGFGYGTYRFYWTINTPAGCGVNIDSVDVAVSQTVTANAGPDSSFCEGTASSFALGTAAATGVSYAWSPAAGLSATAVAQPTFTATASGTYRYTVTAARGACSSTDGVTITVRPLPYVPTVTAPASLCGSRTAVVSIQNPDPLAVYTWSGGLGVGSFKTIGSGSYTITPVMQGCTNSAGSFTITGLATPGASFSVSSTGCNNNFTAANAGVGASYAWNFGATASPATHTSTSPAAPTVTYVTSGSKTVWLITAATNGCSDTAVQAFTPVCVLALELLRFDARWMSGAAQVDWEVGLSSTTTRFDVERSTDAVFYRRVGTVAAKGGTARYSFRDADVPSSAERIYYRLRAKDLSGAEEFSPTRVLTGTGNRAVTAWPNPFSDGVNLSFPPSAANSVKAVITDMAGRTLWVRALGDAALHGSFFVSDAHFPVPGLYIIQLSGDGWKESIQVTKQ